MRLPERLWRELDRPRLAAEGVPTVTGDPVVDRWEAEFAAEAARAETGRE